MTVTLKASYEISGASPDFISSSWQKSFTLPGPLVAGDAVVLLAWSGNQPYAVEINGSSTVTMQQRSYLVGKEAQAGVYYTVLTTAQVSTTVTFRTRFDGGDPYRLAVLHFEGPVGLELVESYRDGAIGASYPATTFDVTTSALTGEKLIYMVGSRNATSVPTSSRGTELFSEAGGHTWAVWLEDVAADGDYTVTLGVPTRSGHAHFVLRTIDPSIVTQYGPAGSNLIGGAQFIEFGQMSVLTHTTDFTTDPLEPQIPDWVPYTIKPAWWKFKPATSGWYKFDTELTEPLNSGSSDTVLSVWWQTTLKSFQLLKWDDDNGSLYTSVVNVHLTGGATYWIKCEMPTGMPNDIYYRLRVAKGDPEVGVPQIQPPDPDPMTVTSQFDGQASFSAL